MRDAADTLHGCKNDEIGPNNDMELKEDLKHMKEMRFYRNVCSIGLLVMFISAAIHVVMLNANNLAELKQLIALREMIIKIEINVEECYKQQQRTILDLQKTVAVLNYTINGIGMYVENDEVESNNDMELKEKLKDEESWFKACTRGHLDTVKLFVENGHDIEAQKRDGVTGLMLASAFGKPDVVRFLLSKGARTERTDAKGVVGI
uniref:ANK_REP_REGION domain-containing protein n=1 Tax=Globodera pallida TaxID=36090 RepID=A0A183C6H8_GLOPA